MTDLAAESGPDGRYCRQCFQHTLEEILRARPWHFAIKRADLPQSTDAPEFGWTYKYPLPSDYIQILECNGYSWDLYAQETYVIENAHILTDETSAKIRYVYKNTNYAEYPSDFVEALAVLLGSKLSVPIRGDSRLAVELKQEYEVIQLPRAATQHANEMRAKLVNRVADSILVQKRRGG